MKLFISWSGKLSHLIAKELQQWLPLVINQLNPFVSSEDIKKGNRWIHDVSLELEQSNFGLVCLTKDNLTAPWIMFEAGALSKNISQSRVSCIFFDGLKQSDIDSPLSLFQNTDFEKEDFKKLLLSINNALGNNRISEIILLKAFEKWYPDLEEKVTSLINNFIPNQPFKRESDSTLTDILNTTKYISSIVSRLALNIPTDSLDFSRFLDEQVLSFLNHVNNHPVRVYINPINNEGGPLQDVTISKKGIAINESKGAIGRGVVIEILFYSEEDIFWTLALQFHKGDTYIDANIADISFEEAMELQYKTIWRD